MFSLKAILLTLSLFGLGGVAGGLMTARVIKARIEDAKAQPTSNDFIAADWIPASVMAMERQVNLTPEQAQRVREIMKHSQQEILRDRDDWRRRSRESIVRADRAIMELLNGPQKEQFEEFKKKRKALFMARQQNGGPMRPGERLQEFMENRPPFRPGLVPPRNPEKPEPVLPPRGNNQPQQ